MRVLPARIPDVLLIEPTRHKDHRGFFSEVYNAAALAKAGMIDAIVQDNHSLSVHAGVVRGLHYQTGAAAQGKLVRVVRGKIIDVALDLRKSSPTFGQHVTQILSAENWQQIYVPAGFAHGFAVLEPNTEVVYKVGTYYAPQAERGILWNDPALGIDWQLGDLAPILSERDTRLPTLKNATDLF